MSQRGAKERWLVAIRIRQFGDVLATLEALRAIKAHDPERRIAYVVEQHFHPVLADLDFIDRLLPAPPPPGRDYATYLGAIRRLGPESVIDFHGSVRSALLTMLSGARQRIGFDVRGRKVAYSIVEPRGYVENGRLLKATSIESALRLARHAGVSDARLVPPEIPVNDEALTRGHNLLAAAGVPAAEFGAGRVVGINPGKPYPAKEWPSERFVTLARALVARGRRVVVMWGPGEEEAARSIADAAGDGVVASPPLSLAELPGVVRALAFLVTIDSGLKHLAVCLRVPTVSLFGATDPREWHMGTADDRYLWKGLSCSPCRRLDCPFGAPCMDFDPDEVLRLVEATEAGAMP